MSDFLSMECGHILFVDRQTPNKPIIISLANNISLVHVKSPCRSVAKRKDWIIVFTRGTYFSTSENLTEKKENINDRWIKKKKKEKKRREKQDLQLTLESFHNY